nr:PREDICTED: outer dense fiber protein 3-like [Opisthocomus hoazin]
MACRGVSPVFPRPRAGVARGHPRAPVSHVPAVPASQVLVLTGIIKISLKTLLALRAAADAGALRAAADFVGTSTTDEPWVGSWRPHRPRGFIMAQFTSPGPKYTIPGTTGYLSHNPTKAKAPAYTFQGPRHRMAEDCSPGPCYYVPPSVTRHGKHVGSAQHLGRRLPGNKMDVTPGPRPNAYTLPRMMGPNTAHTHASPCYSMQGKSKHHSFAEDLAKVSRASLLSRRREGSGARCSPSSRRIPASWGARSRCHVFLLLLFPVQVTLTKPQAPAHTFGLRHSCFTAPLVLDV